VIVIVAQIMPPVLYG